MRKIVLLVLAGLAAPFTIAAGQGKPAGGTISGVVLDGAGHPVTGADVFAFPETARGRSDSAGHFSLTKLAGGFYHVRVRRIGFVPMEITTDLKDNGRVDLKFELETRPALLDSVVVLADGKCPALLFGGFNCRRRFGRGVYLTDDDLAEKGAIEIGDVFAGVAGFRVDSIPTNFGLKPRPLATRGGHCLNALINGKPLALTNPLPRYANELVGVEIYSTPRDVPEEYQRYVWLKEIRQTSSPVERTVGAEPCSLVVYWTTLR
jgi:hypothetical protein